MAEKTVNYTEEQTVELIAAYESGTTVEALAERFGKTTRSIIAKLSREGRYQKKERLTKAGDPVVKKDSLSDQLGMLLNLTEAETESLTKANKTALTKILDFVKEHTLSKDIVS